MKSGGPYLIDAAVFIQAKNQYYAFSICPGFWDSLIGHFRVQNIFSIDHIREELMRGNKTEDLVLWVKNELSGGFFLATRDKEVVHCYEKMMLWVQRSPQFQDYAKAKFATEADGWLAAYAKVYGYTVVTGEQYRPDARNKVPLPNVCREFDVKDCEVFHMLKDLNVQFEWKKQEIQAKTT